MASIAVVILTQHILSHTVVAGHRTLISYKGQPKTCYCCNETEHLYQGCPRRRRTRETENANSIKLWEDVEARGSRKATTGIEVVEVGAEAAELETSVAQTIADYGCTPSSV